MSEEIERLRDEVIEVIARGGKCYTNEAKAMARELIELRKVCEKSGGKEVYYDPTNNLWRLIP